MRATRAICLAGLLVSTSLGCLIEAGGSGETGCHAHASCSPLGLIVTTEWVEGAPWPTDPTSIELRSQGSTVQATCASGGGASGAPVACSLACAPAGETRCRIELPEPFDDPDFGSTQRRELEVGLRMEPGGPVFDVVLHEWFDSAERHAWPRDLEVEFSGPGGEYLWIFEPPNVNLSASASIEDCYVEVCDARLQRVIVGRLEPS